MSFRLQFLFTTSTQFRSSFIFAVVFNEYNNYNNNFIFFFYHFIFFFFSVKAINIFWRHLIVEGKLYYYCADNNFVIRLLAYTDTDTTTMIYYIQEFYCQFLFRLQPAITFSGGNSYFRIQSSVYIREHRYEWLSQPNDQYNFYSARRNEYKIEKIFKNWEKKSRSNFAPTTLLNSCIDSRQLTFVLCVK